MRASVGQAGGSSLHCRDNCLNELVSEFLPETRAGLWIVDRMKAKHDIEVFSWLALSCR